MASYIHVPSAVQAIPKVHLTVDQQDVEAGSRRLMKEVRPHWDPAQVKLKVFTNGITNKLVACYVGDSLDDVVLVRVYGNKTELFVDRENELKSFHVLHAHGCAPRLYCTFQNGLCYKFMEGSALDPEHVRNPSVFRFLTGVPAHQELEQELAWMKKHLSSLGSPIVLCHNDLLCKNIIYNEKEGHVRFIDYEYAGYNYQAFDIGNHFNEFAGVNEVDYSLYPAKNVQLQWLKSYLEALKEYKGLGTDVTDKEVEVLYFQVNLFALASHFFWGLWALIQSRYSIIDFDFLGYAVVRFRQYFKMKPEVMNLKLPE
ncbi:ethanolamine kinase 1 isoform X2 [Carcharodon carcharias]|uniref:ethanolamine kinase 1 isoform X2 n=1 Tax=Carcharodon carcharias TaxID=13397 RepID=UPI001B7DDA2E|nr:ethanolamine kinase 1 isoform X2 [Carcharodon carcharias]